MVLWGPTHSGRDQIISQLGWPKMGHTFLESRHFGKVRDVKMKIPNSGPTWFTDPHSLGHKYKKCQNQLILTSDHQHGTMSIHVKFELAESTQLWATASQTFPVLNKNVKFQIAVAQSWGTQQAQILYGRLWYHVKSLRSKSADSDTFCIYAQNFGD